MDATRARPGIAAPQAADPAAGSVATTTTAHGLTDHAAGLAVRPRGISSVTGTEPPNTARVGSRPVQVLPNGSTQEPGATTSPVAGEPSTEAVAALLTALSDKVAAVQTASNEAAALRATAEGAGKAANAALKEAQDLVAKALLLAGRGNSVDSDAAMAKASEAWEKAAAQQGIADQASAGASAANDRAKSAFDGAQAALEGLKSQGLPRTALLGSFALVEQATKLMTGVSRSMTAAALAATTLRTTLSAAPDPAKVAGVVKLIANAQVDLSNAQKEAKAAGVSLNSANAAAKAAKGKLGAVSTALAAGGTASADPIVAQIKASRDAAAAAAAQAREHAVAAKQLADSATTKAAVALDAAKALVTSLAGKSNPFVASILKAAEKAQTAAVALQRSAASAATAATAAEKAADEAQATLDDANGRVQKYLDDLGAAGNPYDSGGGY